MLRRYRRTHSGWLLQPMLTLLLCVLVSCARDDIRTGDVDNENHPPPILAEFVHGDIVTLQPSHFGLTSFGDDPNLRLFDTIDNQEAYASISQGESIPIGTGNPWRGGGALLETSVAQRHAFDLARYKLSDGACLGTPDAMPYDHPYGPQLYVEWWWRPTEALESGQSTKLIRSWGHHAGVNTRYLSWTQMHVTPCVNDPLAAIWRGIYDTPPDVWRKYRAWIDRRVPNETVLYLYRGVLLHHDENKRPNATCIGDTSEYEGGNPIVSLLGWNTGGATPQRMDNYLGDIYISITPKRFEISEHVDYYASSDPADPYETQEILSWSPGEVQIRIFQGAHETLAGRYLHFVDEENIPSGTPLFIREAE